MRTQSVSRCSPASAAASSAAATRSAASPAPRYGPATHIEMSIASPAGGPPCTTATRPAGASSASRAANHAAVVAPARHCASVRCSSAARVE